MAQPGCRHTKQQVDYPYWAADNACFNKGDAFNLEAYLDWLKDADRSKCLFATAPDVVGDAEATLARSLPVLAQLRDLGYRAAYVAQDGCSEVTLPWETFDCLFIGGTTTFKESEQVEGLVRVAKERGKWVHMGRVNSGRRYRFAQRIGCDSVDGTYLAFGPDKNLPKLLAWIRGANSQPQLL